MPPPGWENVVFACPAPGYAIGPRGSALRRPPIFTENQQLPISRGNPWQPLAPRTPHPAPPAIHTIMAAYTGNSTTSEKLIKPSLRRLFEAVAEFQQEIKQIRDQEREGRPESSTVFLGASAGTQPPKPRQRIDVFARFRDDGLVTCSTTDSGKSWSKPTDLKINFPKHFQFQVVSFNPQRIDVFSSCNGTIGHYSWEGKLWQHQGDIDNEAPSRDGEGSAYWPPIVAQLPSHVFILFYVHSLKRHLWCRLGNYDIMNWSDWTCLSGGWDSKPVAISRGHNTVEVFLVGLDKGLYWKSWADMVWKPKWEKLGEKCRGTPEAVSLHRERIDVFVVNSQGALMTKVWNGKGWGPSGVTLVGLGGCFESGPAIVARDTKRFDLFIIGKDGKLYHKAFDNSIWKPATGFRDLGGNFSTTIPPTAVLTKSGIHVFLVGGAGTSGGAYHKCWDGVDEKTPWDFDHFFGWHCSTPISAIVRDIED